MLKKFLPLLEIAIVFTTVIGLTLASHRLTLTGPILGRFTKRETVEPTVSPEPVKEG